MGRLTKLKDPNEVGPFHIAWCDAAGLNDGTAGDKGYLQGATIQTSTWTVPSGITKDSDHKNAITHEGVSYGANTVATIVLSGGTAGQVYHLVNRIVTNDGRTADQSLYIRVQEN